MAWVYLIIAGFLEIIWAGSLKASDGFARLLPSSVAVVAMLLSFAFLALAMRSLPLGTAYLVWTGIGALGAFVLGVLWFQEALDIQRLCAAGLILAGVLLMQKSGG